MPEPDDLFQAVKRGALEEVIVILRDRPDLVNQIDHEGATPLHYAALGGHRAVAEHLVGQGAAINAADSQFGATPTGWAIEYLREMGGFLGIELSDLAFAIQQGDVKWVRRFLERFPALRLASDTHGRPFRQLAEQCGSPDILRFFNSDSAG